MQLTSIQASFGQLSSNVRNGSVDVGLSTARLSSGNRIVRASDDVASLSVSTKMSSRIISLRSGIVNMAQASSYLQVQDGALQEISSILQRMKALTTQSISALSKAERGFLNQEFQSLQNEISRLLDTTEFNGVNVFADHFKATSATAAFSIPEETLTLPEGAIIHIDPNDPTTIIDGSGLNASEVGFNASDVAQILDISGNNNHISQGNAGERASYVTNVNTSDGDAIRFDGVNDRYTGTVNTTTQQLTTFIINNRTLADGSREFLFEFGGNTNAGRDIIGSHGTEPLYFNAFPFGGGAENRFGVNVPFGQYHMISSSLDVGALETYLDGTLVQDFNLPGGRERDPTVDFTFGDDWTSGDEHTGDIGEFIAYERILTDDERQRVEGYLASRYNLDLPTGHPYADGEVQIVNATSNNITGALDKGGVLGNISPLNDARSLTGVSIVSGNENLAFQANQATGDIEVRDPSKLDIDNGAYELTVRATLDNGQTTDITMNIEVGYNALRFQTDTTSSNSFELDIRALTMSDVFGSQALSEGFDVLTEENAMIASGYVDSAIDVITSRRAETGSLQAAADITANTLEVRLNNQDAARGVIDDTDIALEATSYALSFTGYQSSISISAQTQNLRRTVVLDLLENGLVSASTN